MGTKPHLGDNIFSVEGDQLFVCAGADGLDLLKTFFHVNSTLRKFGFVFNIRYPKIIMQKGCLFQRNLPDFVLYFGGSFNQKME